MAERPGSCLTVSKHEFYITPTTLHPVEDGLEVLYVRGGFGLKFRRGLGIILCWMDLLATLGLTSASSLSIPVSGFLSLGVLLLARSSGTISDAVSQGTLMGFNSRTVARCTLGSMSSPSRSSGGT